MDEVIAATTKYSELLKAFCAGEQLNYAVVNPLEVLNISAENGQSIWPPGSPVHLRGAAYQALAEEIPQLTVFSGSEDTQQSKRLRLDSVVVRPKAVAVMPPPPITPGWSSGTLRGGSAYRGQWRGKRGGRGGQKWRPRYGGDRRGR